MSEEPTPELVAIGNTDGIFVVTLRRPPVNAFDLDLAEAMANAIERVRNDSACLAVVLTGIPGAFSAGIDKKAVPAYDVETRARMLAAVNRLVLQLYSLPLPLVAAINGHAIGGGLVIALAADVRLAARGPFRLGLTEAEAGVPFPAAPMAVVQAELSAAVARNLCLGSAVYAPDAPELAGVVDRVVEPGRLLEEAMTEAWHRSTMPGYARVKEQLRGATIAQLRRIVENNDEPFLEGWVA